MSAQTFTKSDGATLGYLELGEAGAPRTLVCHPGGPGMSGACFGDLCGLPSERVRLVLLDPRGTGASSPRKSVGLTPFLLAQHCSRA